MRYADFASTISFYDFSQKEFKKPHFKISDYGEEISLLKSKIDIERLVAILASNPKVIDIFEEVLQILHFTLAQYAYFCFDVRLLNGTDQERTIRYIDKSVFKFENSKINELFAKVYKRYDKKETTNDTEKICNTKRAINSYILRCMQKRVDFHNHLRNSIGSRIRVARYLVESLQADEYFKIIDLKKYLVLKRHPHDTKLKHANFGINNITKILKKHGFTDVGSQIKVRVIGRSESVLPKRSGNKLCYVREKGIQGVVKRKTGGLKVFDFVLLYEMKPIIAIETNFYTTVGTKIGINEGEYVDLKQDIERLNKATNTHLKFIWITDGNTWLTKDGERRFNRLKSRYFKDEYDILNFNLLDEYLPKIILSYK